MSFGSWFKHTFVGDDATHDAQGNPTEADPSGGLGDGQHGHQGAARGSPRAGVAPSVSSYQLNGDPDYLRQIQQQASALGVDAGNNGNYFNQNAQDISGQANGLAQSGQGLAAQAAQMGQAQNDFFGEQAGNVRSRQAPTTTYGQQLGQQQNLSAAANAAQMGLAQQLQGYAAQPEGPSAAQAQLQQGTNQALASQLALARSGRGLGESATGLSQAGEQASGIVANQANQSAALRAQETQAYRQNQLNALGASGQALGAAQSGSLGLAGQNAQLGQFNTQTALQQQQANDAMASNLYGYGLQGQQLGLQGQQLGFTAQNQGIAQQLAAQQFGSGAQSQALAERATALGLNVSATQAQQQGMENYEQELSNLYGMDIGAQNANRQLNQQSSRDTVNGVLGAVSTLGSLAAASDRRMKRKIVDKGDELGAVYRALGGAA
jgi:hypothetical protein